MNKKDKKSICEIISISVMAVFALISFFILPDTIAIQWNGTQASSYGSKWFMFLPVIIGLMLIPLMHYLESRFIAFSAVVFFTLLIVLFTCQVYMVVYAFYPSIQISVSVLIIIEAVLCVVACGIYALKKRG